MVRPASETAPRDAGDQPASAFETPARADVLAARRAAHRPRQIAIIAGVAVGVLIAIVVLLTLVEHHRYSGRVLPGVEVDGVAASGRHEVTVYDEVARLAVSLERSPLRARVGGQLLSADPSLLDASIDPRATAKAAMATGRTGNPLGQLFGNAGAGADLFLDMRQLPAGVLQE